MNAAKAPRRKVLAASGGALTGLVCSDFANWCVNELAFAPHDTPAPVSAFVAGLAITGFAFAAGYVVPEE